MEIITVGAEVRVNFHKFPLLLTKVLYCYELNFFQKKFKAFFEKVTFFVSLKKTYIFHEIAFVRHLSICNTHF